MPAVICSSDNPLGIFAIAVTSAFLLLFCPRVAEAYDAVDDDLVCCRVRIDAEVTLTEELEFVTDLIEKLGL